MVKNFNVDIMDITNLYDNMFYEFCNALNMLDNLYYSDFYIETVEDRYSKVKNAVNKSKDNSRKVSSTASGLYDSVTDVNANLITASWDLISRGLRLLANVTNFIVKRITFIPVTINKTADKVSHINREIKNQIRGDIDLYITAEDVQNLYNTMIIKRLIDYTNLAAQLTKGDIWGTKFAKRSNSNDSSTKTSIFKGTNDSKIAKQMSTLFNQLSHIEFKPTKVPLDSNPNNVELYFGNGKIQFPKLSGDMFVGSYYDALNLLMTDIKSLQDELESTRKQLDDKIKRMETNHSYNDLSAFDKDHVNRTVSEISKIFSVIGNIVKYIMVDIKTINTNVDKILSPEAKKRFGKMVDTEIQANAKF